MDMFWFIVSLALWAALHSVFANETIKSWFQSVIGTRFMLNYYRLLFNAFSVLSLLPAAYLYRRLEHKAIYAIEDPLRFIFYLIQLLGLGLMYLAIKETGLFRFIGLRPQNDGQGGDVAPFVTAGVYSFVRHPIYTGTYIVFLSDPSMSQAKFLGYLLLSIYLLIGIQFEERRLIHEFGDRYIIYKRKVPMVIPIFKRNNE